MNPEKPSRAASTQPKKPAAPTPGTASTKGNEKGPEAPQPLPRFFRRIDWLTMAITTLLIFVGYFLTLAPDVTLEDSGELATGSFYAGVPHPPGYPVWTLYTWFFTVILPFHNVAWRVGVSSAVAGSLGCGFLALIVSRGSSMMIEGIASLKGIAKREENAICMVSGFVAGLLMGFNGYMWSQSIIVEVYTLSVLSLMGVLGCILRWTYAPHQRRYLYVALFLFGICLTNHMSLLVAAMGIQFAIMCVEPKLGRDMYFTNTVIWLIGLTLKATHHLPMFDGNPAVFAIFNAVGVLSLGGCIVLCIKTAGFGSELLSVVIMFFMWLFGAGFYFYMPIASMTNPPMNWGYPRTVDGFWHALSRGQYAGVDPSHSIGQYIGQIWIYFAGAKDEFSVTYLAIGLVPFLFFRFMQKRERSWLLGLTAIYACLAFFLLYLLNPGSDRQSLQLNKVFFTASHVMVSMVIGYGLALISAAAATNYRGCRKYLLIGGSVAVGLALVTLDDTVGSAFTDAKRSGFGLLWYGVQHALVEHENQIQVFSALILVSLALIFLSLMLVFRDRVPLMAMLGVFALMPLYSITGHWFDNEQRGHLFGFWYGHDMFTPPFGIYPEMKRDAVLFGGTDAGRFCPTYMIFCESQVPPEKRTEDPKFDRRDVYIITQNALADPPYLNYIRAHYNRSTQIDPPFFQIFFGSPFKFLDTIFTSVGKKVEDRRRAEGIYPQKEIHIPNRDDADRAFREYFTDLQARYQRGQLKPGENVHPDSQGRVQIAGQTSVMMINGLIAKDIFDTNPDHEFYVEESFPIDWMYAYESPYGIIMKVNRQSPVELSQEVVDQDHKFWSLYSERLIGNWITYDTPITNLTAFAEKLYLRHDFRGFKGDPKFIRDDDAQKNFSKLRSAQAGLYIWRAEHSKNATEQARMMKEALFALKQAVSFCPYSPEAVARLASLLVSTKGDFAGALQVAETCLKLDPGSGQMQGMVQDILRMKGGPQSGDAFKALTEASNALSRKFTNQAVAIVDQVLRQKVADPAVLLRAGEIFIQAGAYNHLETALEQLVELVPQSPEAWYDLAGLRALLGKTKESIEALKRVALLNKQRLATQPGAHDLLKDLAQDPRFGGLRNLPEYQAILQGK